MSAADRSPPTIRAARIEDAPELARLLTALGHPTESATISARWAEWEAAGNAALVVDGPARGTGIGRALVAAAEAMLATAGCGLVEVTSNVRRADAHAFYEHLGYERTSLRFAKSFPAA